MGRRSAQVNIEKRLKKGFGQGRGKNYKPWVVVQSFSSLGYASRVPGWKTGREHHLMSNLERDFFLILDLSPRVLDICEGFPLLPIEETTMIAKTLGIHHPVDVRTRLPIVLTSDFLITCHGEPRNVEQVRTIKPASELGSLRTLEKLEIERQYWQARKVDWAIVTEAELPQDLVHNLRWLHPYFKLPETLGLPDKCSDKVGQLLREILDRGVGLAAGAQACDDKLGLEPGTSLTLARHFIASRRWQVNLNHKIDTARPLKILNNPAVLDYGTIRQHAA
jgi:hypothetical protein